MSVPGPMVLYVTASVLSYVYLRPSAVYLRPSAGRGSGTTRTLALETCGGAAPADVAAHPRFFAGFLTAPVAAAAAILAVADVAATRFDQSAAASLDPVVTAGGGLLRLESFSGCGGVYARLDILPPGLDGDDVGHGTTNVDVNPPLRRALAVLGGLRPASRPAPGAVCLPGVERLSVLQAVLRHATTVRLYAPADTDGQPAAVAWECRLPGMRLVLMLSPDAYRGFSGEGGVLNDLAAGPAAEDAADLLAEFPAGAPRVTVAALSRQAGLPADRVRRALTVLGSAGQIGYDLAEEAYFRRQLPWSAGAAEAYNPRLGAARALVADEAVRLDGAQAEVGRGDGVNIVRTDDAGRLSCTCVWWARYRGGRGPCRHVLAVRMVRDSTTEATP
jgi:hypothetical protein